MTKESFAQPTCVAPQEIVEGDLMAYVYGTASPQVVAHVQRCPACQAQVAAFSQAEGVLLSTFFRTECPAADDLVAYHEGRFSGNQQLIVAAHVRECPHCAEELALLEQADRVSPLLERIRDGVGLLRGVLTAPRLQAAAVRSPALGQQLHQAPGVDIIIDVQPAAQPGHYAVQGLIVPRDGEAVDAAASEAWLLHGDEVVQAAPVSQLGRFTFAPVCAGEYGIVFPWRGQTVWLPEVGVG